MIKEKELLKETHRTARDHACLACIPEKSCVEEEKVGNIYPEEARPMSGTEQTANDLKVAAV